MTTSTIRDPRLHAQHIAIPASVPKGPALSVEQPTPPLAVISLFTGVGGIEIGLEQSGASVTTTVCERWAPARSVLSQRFRGVPASDDVEAVRSVAGAGLLTAGFPCTDLSQAGLTRGLDGANSGLVLTALRLVQQDRPAWVLLENVPNMLHLGGGHAIARIVAELEAAGYRWAYRVVDSRFTGLAQRRRRVLLLASLEADPAPLLLGQDAGPMPPHPAPTAFGFSWTEGNRGLGWAVGAVPTLKGGTTVRVASPPGIWLPGSETGHAILRPSIEAAEVLQGLEPGWTDAAPERDRWKLVGNAVSTRVARWIGDRLVARTSLGDGAWAEEAIADSVRWPTAARGEDGRRWRALVSEYPTAPATGDVQDLAHVLAQHGSEPLSFRATRGFRDRLARSRLRYRPEFMTALNEHVTHQER